MNLNGRQPLSFSETEDAYAAAQWVGENRKHFASPDGWVFVSHRGVIRGFDICGVEPATMVVNYRYGSAFELMQTLGRGNRSQVHMEDAPLYVFAEDSEHQSMHDLR